MLGEELGARSTGHEDTVAEAEPRLVGAVEALQLGREPVSLAGRVGGESRRGVAVVALLAERQLRDGRRRRAEPRVGVDELDLLGLGHRVGDRAGAFEAARPRSEWPRRRRAAQRNRARPRRAARRRAMNSSARGARVEGRSCSPAAGVAQEAGAGFARRPCAGSRRSSGRRRSAGARPASVSAARSATSGVGRAPSRTRSVAAARIGVAATEPSATRTFCQPCRPKSSPGQGHDDLARSPARAACRPCGSGARARREREADLEDQLVRRQRRLPIRDEVVLRRDLALAPLPADEDHRVGREQDRQRVARGRGVGDVAADRAAVLDLCRADRRRRLDERRQVLAAQRRAADLRVRRPGAEHEPVRTRARSRAARRCATGPASARGSARARR